MAVVVGSAMATARRDLADRLTDAGIGNVSLDPRVQPPGVLVDTPAGFIPLPARAGWEVAFVVRVLAPPPGDADALDFMLATAEACAVALGVANVVGRSGTVTLAGKDLPAFTLELAANV